MNKLYDKLSPPGINTSYERACFTLGNLASCLLSLIIFMVRYADSQRELYRYINGQYVLMENMRISAFTDLAEGIFSPFILVSLCLLCFIPYRYLYFRRGSMSIYLMKRLPKRSTMHIMALAIPLLEALMTAIIMLLTVLICMAIYLIATPRVCIPDSPFLELWRLI